MAESKTTKSRSRTGKEAGAQKRAKKQDKTKVEKEAKTSSENTTKGGVGKDYIGNSEAFESQIIRDSETAKERGRNGGIKSGETRRNQRDARSAIRYLLDLRAKDRLEENLTKLGYPDEEMTNMAALQARLYTMAMSGNLDAYITLMKMGGYDPEETRKERESLASDKRRDMEVKAKVEAIGSGSADVAVNTADEDGFNDVVIYLPEIADEKDLEPDDARDGEEQEEAAGD